MQQENNMNIKKTINFTNLRKDGPSSLDIKKDEVIQLAAKNEMLCIVRQEFLIELLKNKPATWQESHHLFSATSTPKLSANIMGSVNSFLNAPEETRLEKISRIEESLVQLTKEIKNLKENKDGTNKN